MSTKQDLVNKLIKKVPDVPAQDVSDTVDLVWGAIAEELVRGNRAEIRGFGSFGIRSRKLSAKSSLPNRDSASGDKVVKSAYYRVSQGVLTKINK